MLYSRGCSTLVHLYTCTKLRDDPCVLLCTPHTLPYTVLYSKVYCTLQCTVLYSVLCIILYCTFYCSVLYKTLYSSRCKVLKCVIIKCTVIYFTELFNPLYSELQCEIHFFNTVIYCTLTLIVHCNELYAVIYRTPCALHFISRCT